MSIDRRTEEAGRLAEEWSLDPRWEGVERSYGADEVVRLRGSVRDRAQPRAPRRRAPLAAPAGRAVRRRPRRADRPAGGADGEGRAEGDLPVGLAGRGRREHSPATPTPTRASTRPTRRRGTSSASTTRCCAPTRSPGPRAATSDVHWLAPIVADAEAGFGGPLNAFELMRGDDRVRRRGRALRGPARVREEVRPPRRQGAGADLAVRAHARRRAPGGRRLRRADGPRGPHRRPLGDAHHQRRRRARPPVPDGRAHLRGLLPRHAAASRAPSPAASPTRATPT